jgi:hypothetical protein
LDAFNLNGKERVEMKRILREITNQSLTETLKKQFEETTKAFEFLLIPFSLVAVKEGEILKLQESEVNILKEDYENFKLKIKLLIRTTYMKSKNIKFR